VTTRNRITIYIQDIDNLEYENIEQAIQSIYCSTAVKHMYCAAADKNQIL